ncbi:MAG: hypothetical protein QM500_01595 [Methylococcales bacterium]
MIDSIFSSGFYKALPGLVVGFSVCLFAVISASLPLESSYEQYHRIMGVLSLIICISVILFGVIAKLYGQPTSFLYNCLLSGAIGIVVTAGLLYEF